MKKLIILAFLTLAANCEVDHVEPKIVNRTGTDEVATTSTATSTATTGKSWKPNNATIIDTTTRTTRRPVVPIPVRTSPKFENVIGNISKLPRLLNGIALQKDILSGHVKIDDVAGTLLKVGNVSKIADLSVDPKAITKNIDKVISSLPNVGELPDVSKIGAGIRKMDELKKIVEKTGASVPTKFDVNSILNKFEVPNMPYNSQKEVFQSGPELSKLAKHLKDLKNGNNPIDAVNGIKDSIATVYPKIKRVLDYKSTLGDIFSLKDLYKSFDPLSTLSDLANKYMAVSDLIPKSLNPLKKVNALIRPFLEKNPSLKTLTDWLKEVAPMAASVAAPYLAPFQPLLDYLPDGLEGLTGLFGDLAGGFFEDLFDWAKSKGSGGKNGNRGGGQGGKGSGSPGGGNGGGTGNPGGGGSGNPGGGGSGNPGGGGTGSPGGGGSGNPGGGNGGPSGGPSGGGPNGPGSGPSGPPGSPGSPGSGPSSPGSPGSPGSPSSPGSPGSPSGPGFNFPGFGLPGGSLPSGPGSSSSSGGPSSPSSPNSPNQNLQNALEPLKDVADVLSKAGDSMKCLLNFPKANDVFDKFKKTLDDIGKAGDLLDSQPNMDDIIDKAEKLAELVKPVTGDLPVGEFKKAYEMAKKIGEKAADLEEMMNKVMEGDLSDFEDIANKVKDTMEKLANGDITPSDVIDLLKNVPGIDKFTDMLEKAGDLLSNPENAIEKLLNELKKDPITALRDALDGSGIFGNLEKLLKGEGFDLEKLDSLLNLVGNVTELIVGKEEAQTVKMVIDTVKDVRDGILQVRDQEGKLDKTKLLGKFEKAMEQAKSVEEGVKNLEKMYQIFQKKDTVYSALNCSSDVINIIEQIQTVKSVYTKETREKIVETIEKIELLVIFVETNTVNNVSDYKHVFEKSSEIRGVNIDQNLFKDPIAVTLRSSRNTDAQQVAPHFEEMSLLNFTFVQQTSPAGSALEPIGEAFSEVFAVKEVEKPEEMHEFPVVLFLILISSFLFVLVGILCGLIFFQFWRYRKLKYLYKDPNCYELLLFTKENSLESDEKHNLKASKARKLMMSDDFEGFKKHTKRGVYLDARVQSSEQSNTLLHEAVTLKDTKYLQLLIELGADRELLNHEHETPVQMAKKLKKKQMVEVFKQFEGKKFVMGAVSSLKKEQYAFDAEKVVKEEKESEYDKFVQKFPKNSAQKNETPTHFIVKTNEDGIFILEEPSLPIIFSPTMIMSHKWIKGCLEKPSSFANNKEYRVKSFRFKNVTYSNLARIKESINRCQVPFLFGANVFFYQDNKNWSTFEKVCKPLGAQFSKTFPETDQKEGHLYYREDIGRNVIVYRPEDSDDVTSKFGQWKSDPKFSWFDSDQLAQLLLEFKMEKGHAIV